MFYVFIMALNGNRVNAFVCQTTTINHHLLLLLNVYSAVVFVVNLQLKEREAHALIQFSREYQIH